TTAGKLEKIRLLADHLAALDTDDAALAALYFTGRPFPQSAPRALNVGWAVIKRVLLDVAGLNEGDFRQAYSRFGDSGDTAAAMLDTRTRPSPAPLADVARFFEALAEARGPAAKLDLLRERIRA